MSPGTWYPVRILYNLRIVDIRIDVYMYKDRAAPPIGGPALDDSGVKTVQWRDREGHDAYQDVEVYIYILCVCDKYSS